MEEGEARSVGRSSCYLRYDSGLGGAKLLFYSIDASEQTIYRLDNLVVLAVSRHPYVAMDLAHALEADQAD